MIIEGGDIYDTDMEAIMVPWHVSEGAGKQSIFVYRRLWEIEVLNKGDLYVVVDEDHTYLFTVVDDDVDSCMNALALCIKEANKRGMSLAVPHLGNKEWNIMKWAYNGLMIDTMEKEHELYSPRIH